MEKTGMGKRLTAITIALIMMAAAVFCTDQSVSAASLKNSTVTAQASAVSVGAIRIKWNKVSGARYYRIWRKKAGGTWKKLRTVYTSTGSYLDSGLTEGTTYYYVVRAYGKSGGKWVWSKYKALKTATVTLADVTAVPKVISNSRIDISWNRVGRSGGYAVYRKVAGGTWKRLAYVSKSKSSYSDKTVSASVTYTYCVRAYRKQGGKTNWSKKIESSTVSTSAENYSKFNASQKEVMKTILYAVETGGQVYGKQDYADFTEAFTNSKTEYAITIGAGQWYATEAKRLLQNIYSQYPSVFTKLKNNKKYDVAGLIKDLKNADWSKYKLKKTSKKAKTIVAIINTTQGRKCQDALMYEQIEAMQTIVRKLGVTEIKAVGECINIMHQGGQSAVTRILAKVDAKKQPYTLESLYDALNTDTGGQVGTYKNRQKCVYDWLNQYMK